MCADTSLGSEVRELIAKAVKAPLPQAQQQVIFSGLEQDAKLVYHCGLTPRKFLSLHFSNFSTQDNVASRLLDGVPS